MDKEKEIMQGQVDLFVNEQPKGTDKATIVKINPITYGNINEYDRRNNK